MYRLELTVTDDTNQGVYILMDDWALYEEKCSLSNGKRRNNALRRGSGFESWSGNPGCEPDVHAQIALQIWPQQSAKEQNNTDKCKSFADEEAFCSAAPIRQEFLCLSDA